MADIFEWLTTLSVWFTIFIHFVTATVPKPGLVDDYKQDDNLIFERENQYFQTAVSWTKPRGNFLDIEQCNLDVAV